MLRNSIGLHCLFSGVVAQQAGTQKPEEHPPLSIQQCNGGSCWDEQASIVLDAQYRWLHDARTPEGYENCIKDEGDASSWDPKMCPDPRACAQNCAFDGVDGASYADTYGIHPIDKGFQFSFEVGSNVGTQVYVLENDETYKLFRLKNKEIAFDVNLASLDCGMNAAVYLVSMDASGQKSDTNTAGAKFGTGYCDAQCPKQQKFIQGEANMVEWWGADGSGHFGSCCTEFDLLEGNNQAAAFTAHPCVQQTRCEGTDCGDMGKGERYLGLCDKDGCDFNSYRMGVQDFYGPGKRVDTMQPFTVVTQFLTADGSDGGQLSEVKQFYVQNGQVIEPPQSAQQGVAGDSISDGYCSNVKHAFINTRAKKNPQGDFDQFTAKGGLGTIGAALDAGMVLVMSVWDDPASGMRWLDSDSPRSLPVDTPGVVRGPCSPDQGEAAQVEAEHPDASVSITNIRYGDIGSTAQGLPGPRPAAPAQQPAPFDPPVVAQDEAATLPGSGYGYGVADSAGAQPGYGYGVTAPAAAQAGYGYGVAAPAGTLPYGYGVQRKEEVGRTSGMDTMLGQRIIFATYAPAFLAVALVTLLVLLVAFGRRRARMADELKALIGEDGQTPEQVAE